MNLRTGKKTEKAEYNVVNQGGGFSEGSTGNSLTERTLYYRPCGTRDLT